MISKGEENTIIEVFNSLGHSLRNSLPGFFRGLGGDEATVKALRGRAFRAFLGSAEHLGNRRG